MVKITATYQGDLCCEATHGPSGNQLSTDAPKDNMGLGRYFSPTDLVATALGTCVMTTMAIVAKRNEVDFSGASVEVEKHMNESPRRIGRLPVKLTIQGTFTDDQKKKLEAAARACPVHRSLHPDIESEVTIVWVG